MEKKTNVINVKPEPTDIEKIAILCPECGQYQTIFGNWPIGLIMSHKCEKCKEEMILRVNNQAILPMSPGGGSI